jgi:hypothetical protein
MVRRAMSSIISIGILGLLLVLGMLIAPRVDERVGFLTGRAMKAVQCYQVDGVPLRSLVDREFQSVRWRSYHHDIPFQTVVECAGTPRSGGPERRMAWYVDERPTWDKGPSLSITIMTALNGNAYHLTPHLCGPGAGFGWAETPWSPSKDAPKGGSRPTCPGKPNAEQ